MLKAIGISLLLCLLTGLVQAETFDNQRETVSKSIATQPESAIASLLKAGLAEEKVSQAHSVAQGWFLQNQPKNPETLRLAGLVAERSAHYPAAVAFYQQYVAKADVKSASSQETVMRLYKLMVDVMGNKNNAAYLYMVNNAGRFMPYGSARQYNTWILDNAARINWADFIAVLADVCRSKPSKDELDSMYRPYFRKALNPDRRVVGRATNEDIEIGKRYVDLGSAVTHDDRLKLVYTCRGKIWAYNAVLVARAKYNQTKPKTPKLIPAPPLEQAEALLKKYPEYGYLVWSDLNLDRYGRDASYAFKSKGADLKAKVALIEKYLPKMPPIVRYRTLQTLVAYDKKLVHGKELAMLKRVRVKNVKMMGSKTPETQREKEFRKLIADFDKLDPKEPYVAERLVSLVAGHPSVWSEMMSTPERQWILYRAITEKVRVSADTYRPVASSWNNSPHWSEPYLRKAVSDQAAKKKIVPWLLMAWINSYRPPGFKNRQYSDVAAVPVMAKVKALAAYAKIPHHLRSEIQEGAATFRLPTESEMAGDKKKKKKKGKKKLEPAPNVVAVGPFKEILALNQDADAAAVSAAIKAVLPRLKAIPRRVRVKGEAQLAALKGEVIGDPQVMPLIMQLFDNPHVAPWGGSEDQVFDAILDRLMKSPDAALLHRHAHCLWSRARRTHRSRGLAKMVSLQNLSLQSCPSAAATLARAHLFLLGLQAKKTDQSKSGTASATAILSRANQAMKLNVIAVDESDPAYPVYKSQNDFIAGNVESAWKLFEENAETAMAMTRKLSADYWLWVLARLIDQRDETGQKRVVTALREWRGDSATAFSKGQAVMLDILYGDIARQRGGRGLDNALKIYKAIVAKKEYAGVPEQYTAILRQINVERIMKNFSAALATADRLIRLKAPELWGTARYAKALVYYDMKDYGEAKDLVDEILARMPGHKDAKILEGKILLKRRALVDASEVEIPGSAVEKNAISPGEMMKLTLTDPTLAVSGGGTDIEVDVWATSGDRETILLAQFGDSKTKFRGKAKVVLGKPIKGDGILQVIGDDKVYYAYSKRFMEKVKIDDAKQGGPLTILSDSTLMASARKLLSVLDQKKADAEALVSSMVSRDTLREMSAQEKAEMATSALSKATAVERARLEKQIEREAEKARVRMRVKPGNPIYLRVVDEDRSRTAGIDSLVVSVESSSGDAVGQVLLKETGNYTGTFEGILKTRGAQAMAFASSTRPGLNPNMVISPKPHPAWRSAPGKSKGTAVLTVDLNDNVAVDKLTITAAEPGMALQKFRLLSGLNRRNLETVATWPATPMPRDPLAPSLFIVQQSRRRNGYGCPAERQPYKWDELAKYLDGRYVIANQGMYVESLASVSQAFSKSVFEHTPWVKAASHHNHVRQVLASRFRGYFHEKEDVTRHFRVVLGKAPKYVIARAVGKHNAKWDLSGKILPCFVMVDGRPLPSQGSIYQGKVRLNAGLHRFEILSQGRAGAIGFGRSCKVQTRLSEEEEWVDCPHSMFDPTSFSASVKERFNAPSSISRNKAGTEWTVKFAKGARARVLALEFLEHEGSEAALSKLSLTAVGGKKVLPVASDYSDLRKNDTLEILTGDKVWVRYLDDRFANRSKERQERVLMVSFSDGRPHFSDIEPRWNKVEGKMEPFREPILRFRLDEKLSLVVDDPDMDISDKSDTVKVTLANDSGQQKVVTLTETNDPGVFRAFIVPVNHAAGKPDEFQVALGDTIRMTYWDRENERPGVPYERTASIRHAKFETPQVGVTHMTYDYGMSIDGKLYKSGDNLPPGPEGKREWAPRTVISRRLVDVTSPEAKQITVLLDHTDNKAANPTVDILAPTMMLRPSSTLRMFVQTDTGRKKAGGKSSPANSFDVTVPGTRMLTLTPAPEPPGGRHAPISKRGIFRTTLTYQTGAFPTPGTGVDTTELLRYATAGTHNPLTGKPLEEFQKALEYAERLRYRQTAESLGRELKRCKLEDPLIVKPGERIYFGFRYEDASGKARWITGSAKVATFGSLTVVAERKNVNQGEGVSLGDRIRVKVQDFGFDKTDGMDSATVKVSDAKGTVYPLTVKESEVHSGVFEGSFVLQVAKGKPPTDLDIGAMGFPAEYGDVLSVSFADSAGRQLEPRKFIISSGSDGVITPFTKKYSSPEIASRTQFAMAEAYLEVAKRYLKLKEPKKAAISYRSAKQLLASTMDRFTDAETRAHALYLLGNLTYEEAGNTKDRELREERFQVALAHFQKVTSTYPDTEFGAKAQFKKAVTYERLKEADIAAQEYVKLAYKYPESQYLATAMYRLGAHFLIKASQVRRELAPLLAKIKGKEAKNIDRDLQFKIDQLIKARNENYIKSGKIFARLHARFPTHELAAKAGLRAGQAYYQVKQYDTARAIFRKIVDNESYAGVERAEAMYWAGKCNGNLGQPIAAYALYMRCTEDFPETKWSGYCFGELSKPQYVNIDRKMNSNKVEEGLQQ